MCCNVTKFHPESELDIFDCAQDNNTLLMTWKGKKEKINYPRLNRAGIIVPEPLSFRRDCRQCITHLGTPDTPRCIDYVTDIETVKLTG